MKEIESTTLLNLHKSKRKLNEPTSQWLERIILIADNAGLEEEYARQIISQTFIYDESYFLFRDFFKSQPLYENIKIKIQLIRAAEIEKAKKERQKADYLILQRTHIKTKEDNSKTKDSTEKHPQQHKKFYMNTLITKSEEIKTKEIILNGDPIPAILDTGSNVNIISKKLAEEKGLLQLKTEKINIENIFGHYNTNNNMRRWNKSNDDLLYCR